MAVPAPADVGGRSETEVAAHRLPRPVRPRGRLSVPASRLRRGPGRLRRAPCRVQRLRGGYARRPRGADGRFRDALLGAVGRRSDQGFRCGAEPAMGRRILPGRPGVQKGGGHRRGAPPRGGPRETAPPQGEDSLWTLLHIAHEASGIAGTPRLASRRIIISSAVVSDHRAGDTTADIDFLNSFFLDGLATVQMALADGRCPSALSEYLTADALLPTNLRSDVITEHAVARRPARRGSLRIVPGGHAPPRGLPGQRGR